MVDRDLGPRGADRTPTQGWMTRMAKRSLRIRSRFALVLVGLVPALLAVAGVAVRALRSGRDVANVPYRGSVRRLFAVYAAASLVPVLLLGVIVLRLLGAQGDAGGIAEGRAKADLIAHTSIAPLLDGSDLRAGLMSGEQLRLRRTVGLAVRDREVLRLRLRDLDGKVVFANDTSGGGADDEALDAARGNTVAGLTWLNSDSNDRGPRGARVVEIYQPLNSTQSGHRIGVLEMYLPYAPIAADISHGQRTVALTLSGGLILVWLCLLAVSASVTARLRRQATLSAFLASHDALTAIPRPSRRPRPSVASRSPCSTSIVSRRSMTRWGTATAISCWSYWPTASSAICVKVTRSPGSVGTNSASCCPPCAARERPSRYSVGCGASSTSRCRSTGCRWPSRPAWASPSHRMTGPRSVACSSVQTWRCMPPSASTSASRVTASSTTTTTRPLSPWSPSSAPPSPMANCCCTTSRKPTCVNRRSPRSRPWFAGNIRPAACSTRTRSCPQRADRADRTVDPVGPAHRDIR